MSETVSAPRTGRLRLAVALILAAAVVLAVVLASRFGDDPTAVAPQLIGQPLPDLELAYLEQPGSLNLSDLEGRVAVINFWASWCIPCRAEHPLLVAAAEQYGGVEFVGVVFQDQPESAVAFLDELGRGYTYVVDPESRAAVELGVFGIPETYFVDADGVIVSKVQGQLNPQVLESTLNAILLGQVPGAQNLGTVQSQR